MEPEDIAAAAESLADANRTGEPIGPLTSRWPDMTAAHAYAIQLANIDLECQRGQKIKGHKVGLTSAVMQNQMGVDSPDFGHLLGGMFWPEFASIPLRHFIQPRVEPEIAFVLGRKLEGPGISMAEAARAVSFVLPAIEIIDSRIRDWRISLPDTIADNASSGGVVLGSRPVALSALNLRLTGCLLRRNGHVAATGAGGAVLGSPLLALTWLANTLGAEETSLEEGAVILPGSCTAAVPVSPGDVFAATFAGLGSVSIGFGSQR